MRVADPSTGDLGDPNSCKASIQTLADHFSSPLSNHTFNLEFALKELNGAKALKAGKFKGYEGKISFWQRMFEEYHDKFPHFFLIIELCLYLILSSSTVERGFSTVKRHLTDTRLGLSNESLDELLVLRLNVPVLQKLDPAYEDKLVSKAIDLYLNAPNLKQGRYSNTTTRNSNDETQMVQAKDSPDLFLPVTLAAVFPMENELLVTILELPVMLKSW